MNASLGSLSNLTAWQYLHPFCVLIFHGWVLFREMMAMFSGFVAFQARGSIGMILLVLILPASGCNRNQEGPQLAKVTGVLTWNGQPVPQTKVLFEPVSNAGPSWGTTDGGGKFEVYYTPDRSGAAVGKHRVQFQSMNSEDSGGKEIKIPRKYTIGAVGIEVEVSEGTNEFPFDLGKSYQ